MRLFRVSIAAIWTSVALTTLGAHFRNRSPQFEAWEQSVYDQIDASLPDWGGPRFGIAMGMTPAFSGLRRGHRWGNSSR
jgi:hypothetical protein